MFICKTFEITFENGTSCIILYLAFINNSLPAEAIPSAAERVKGLFLGNIVFLCQIFHADLQLLFFCSVLPLHRKLPGTN